MSKKTKRRASRKKKQAMPKRGSAGSTEAKGSKVADAKNWLLKKGERVEFAFSGLYYGGIIKGNYRTRHW
jgi:hypothetical protein